MGSFIANAAGRRAFMEMATKAVRKAIDTANANNLPKAYDVRHPSTSKKHTDTKQTRILKKTRIA